MKKIIAISFSVVCLIALSLIFLWFSVHLMPWLDARNKENIKISQIVIQQEEEKTLNQKETKKQEEKNQKLKDNEHYVWAKKNGKLKQAKFISQKWSKEIKAVSEETGIDYAELAAIATVESGGDKDAVNKNGKDFGLTQMQIPSAEEVGISEDEIMDPQKNLLAGARYIKKYSRIFGSMERGFLAHRKGPGNVKKILKKGKRAEDYLYVQRVKFLAAYIKSNA